MNGLCSGYNKDSHLVRYKRDKTDIVIAYVAASRCTYDIGPKDLCPMSFVRPLMELQSGQCLGDMVAQQGLGGDFKRSEALAGVPV